VSNISVPVKFIIIGSAAALATVLCFILMYLLIAGELERQPDIDIVQISIPVMSPIRDKHKRAVRKKIHKMIPAELPPDPKGPFHLPETQIVTKAEYLTLGSLAEILSTEDMSPKITAPLKDLIPLSIVHPHYPFKATMKQIEGFVLVQFTVRENGSVKNPIIINSEPGSLFDESAIAAVSKFKFVPREVGGDPMEVDGVKIRFAYKLDSPYADQTYVD
jgi:protein TonB|tara:strand:- start:2979 stop:3635 length:657 start_codon:yes stop_codon:yes gene_type:complete